MSVFLKTLFCIFKVPEEKSVPPLPFLGPVSNVLISVVHYLQPIAFCQTPNLYLSNSPYMKILDPEGSRCFLFKAKRLIPSLFPSPHHADHRVVTQPDS